MAIADRGCAASRPSRLPTYRSVVGRVTENEAAAARAVMNVLKAFVQTLGCFVLGVDHFKNMEAGTRGARWLSSDVDTISA